MLNMVPSMDSFQVIGPINPSLPSMGSLSASDTPVSPSPNSPNTSASSGRKRGGGQRRTAKVKYQRFEEKNVADSDFLTFHWVSAIVSPNSSPSPSLFSYCLYELSSPSQHGRVSGEGHKWHAHHL